MDTTKYKELFISEAADILTALNLGLVMLEKHPDDGECLNEIFRHVHTLKGMSATMGYDDIMALAHEMEGVLDLLRQGKIRVDRDTANLLFKSVDLLELLVNRISGPAKKGSKSQGIFEKDISVLIKKLKKIRDAGADKVKSRSPVQEKQPPDPGKLVAGDEAKISKAGVPAYGVTITLKQQSSFKNARFMVVLKVLEEIGEIVNAGEVHAKLNGGDVGKKMSFVFLTGKSSDLVAKKVRAIADVENVIIRQFKIGEESKNAGRPDTFEQRTTSDERRADVQMTRVSLDKLDQLMNVVGELVINRIRLANIGKGLACKELDEALAQTGRLVEDLRTEMMDVRLVPMDYIFNRFPRMVRDLAGECGKDIDLIIEGADIGLDRTILDEINEPLVHLLRNAVTHGIEKPAEREKRRKSRTGTVRLSARRERNFVVVEIFDDGSGMDIEEIKRIAIEMKIASKEEVLRLDVKDILMLITSPGFTTIREVTKGAGRGVGMNSVRKAVESVGGSLGIESSKGSGSTFTLKLPLTMAIVQALLVGVADEVYAIPLVNVVEIIKTESARIKKVEHHEVISYRDTVLPLVTLRDKFGFTTDTRDVASIVPRPSSLVNVVVLESGHRKAGAVVDRLLGQQEVVIKTLDRSIRDVDGMAGATILGDGRVAMILDVVSIV